MKVTAYLTLCLLALLAAIPAAAQWDKKAYTEWSEKEAQKVINDSPWGQTQVFSDLSQRFAAGPGRGVTSSQTRDASGTHVNFRVRFLSARPVRQAFSRLIGLRQKDAMNDQLAAQLKAFAEAEFPDYVVVTVDCDSTTARDELTEATALLHNRTLVDLKNNTYLQVKDRRTFIQEYQPPRRDGLGARFIFPRLVDGQPLLTPESGDVRFYAELSSGFTLDRRFKVKDMMYQGKLEY